MRNVECLPKIKLLIWKILHEAIPTGSKLERRGVLSNTTCVYCREAETTNHLFLQCTFATQVWSLVPLKVPFCSSNCTSFASALEISEQWICLPPPPQWWFRETSSSGSSGPSGHNVTSSYSNHDRH